MLCQSEHMNVEGVVDPAFAPVRDVVVGALDSGADSGGSVAVWHDGRWVVDLWGGSSDSAGSRAWRQDTLAMTYSTSKAFVAVCALVLVDRGVLDLDAEVQRYWPEFHTVTTLRELLSHQAGLVALDEKVSSDVFFDWERLCGLLAHQKPSWAPGQGIGESALFYGHLVGELIRRTDGRSVGEFLRNEICAPHEVEFFIGLNQKEQQRVADLAGVDDDFRVLCETDRPELFTRALGNPPGSFDGDLVNSSRFRAAQVPAINGHGTARGVASLYAALLKGQILSAETLAEATRTQASGDDLVLGGPFSWGLGFGTDEHAYGMGGIGGSMGVASTDGGYAYGFVPRAMGTHDRANAVENAVRACMGLPPLPEE
jgi:CubicO group peptidase (beta-lactamase class C family)